MGPVGRAGFLLKLRPSLGGVNQQFFIESWWGTPQKTIRGFKAPFGKILPVITQPVHRQPLDLAPPSFLAKSLAALLGGAALSLAIALLFSAIYSLAYLGRIIPGVAVGGVDLSGTRRTQAAQLLGSQLDFPLSGQITLTYGERGWTFTPFELGLRLDAEASAEAAYGYGRSFWPWESVAEKLNLLRNGVELAPRMLFDGQAAHRALEGVAADLNQPTIEAELSVQGADVQVRPGQVGLALDMEKTSAWLAAQLLRREDGIVPLAVIEQPPRILDVSEQAGIAREILSQPLRIVPGGEYENNPNPLVLQPEDLAGMISIERVEYEDGARYQVGLDGRDLAALLVSIASSVAAEPQNARFIFNDETRELEPIKPAVIGRTLEVDLSIEHINQRLAQGAHEIELQYDYTDPEIGDEATAAGLGITELVSAQTTYFYGSSAARIQNIQTAASRFHGLLVPPGAVFSMVENIGDISLDSGFAEALIIFGDRTIKGVGGGVCQVSTTLFRAVFFGGFPVIERYPHAYRVSYYEYNAAGQRDSNLVGLDATVYAPVVDFKFQNDTPYWLLMETYVDAAARTITWKFYSTSDGRQVERTNTGPRNTVDPPEDVYEENQELDKGEVKQVDWAAEGADVTVTRTVTRNGEVLYNDTFTTHYQPWANVYQYGPGTKIIKAQNND